MQKGQAKGGLVGVKERPETINVNPSRQEAQKGDAAKKMSRPFGEIRRGSPYLCVQPCWWFERIVASVGGKADWLWIDLKQASNRKLPVWAGF